MKKMIALVVGIILFTSYSALSQNDKDYLKNYKAPNFKIRGLNVYFDALASGGGTSSITSNQQYFSNDLFYFQRSNQERYQGSVTSLFSQDLGHSKNVISDVNILGYDYLLRAQSQNFWYLKGQWFAGFHNYAQLSQNYNRVKDTSISLQTTQLNLNVSASPTIGYGRLEPVTFGRQAMDIERLLLKTGRISGNFNEQQRTELANKIAQIENKRFYDIRLGRIYQLEAIDSVMGDMGLVTSRDIRYYSRLQDAYLYNNLVQRLSGWRNQIGFAANFDYTYSKNTSGISSDTASFNPQVFNLFSYHLPQSYSIQHDFEVMTAVDLDSSSAVTGTIAYNFGWFPTTRTYLGAGVLGGISHVNGVTGRKVSVGVNSYYYVSPKLRLEGSFYFNAREDYNNHNLTYLSSERGYLPTSQPRYYSFSVGLNYAIF